MSGDRGFWDRYGPAARDTFDFDPGDWALERHGIHVKYYPCCYFTHTSIAATQALVSEHDIDSTDIERIRVRAAPGAADALHHPDPGTGLEAKFSMEYAVACAAVRDCVGLDAFDDDTIDDPAVQNVRERVRFETAEDRHYDSHEASVRIDTVDAEHERHQENPPGTHDDPLSDRELRSKFEECAVRAVPDRSLDALATVFATIDDYDDVPAAVRE